MGRDIAGGKDRDGRLRAQQAPVIVGGDEARLLLVLLLFPTLRTSTRRSASLPAVSYTFRFHGLYRV